MAYSVAYQHTDSYRNHDGSDIVYGVKVCGTGDWYLFQGLRVKKHTLDETN